MPGKVHHTIIIRPATLKDAEAISSVLTTNLGDPGLFQKSAAAIRRSIGDFLVAQHEAGEIVGCGGVHRDSPELAEIYAVAVLPGFQSQGIGGFLMEACKRRGVEEGAKTVWLATIKPGYFARYGFQRISRWDLPFSVLARKLKLVFEQPAGRWIGAIFGRHTFMRFKTR